MKIYQKLYYKYLFSRAIESMFDLVKRYSHRSRKKDLNINNSCLFNKLKQVISIFETFIYSEINI